MIPSKGSIGGEFVPEEPDDSAEIGVSFESPQKETKKITKFEMNAALKKKAT